MNHTPRTDPPAHLVFVDEISALLNQTRHPEPPTGRGPHAADASRALPPGHPTHHPSQ
ncbi:hypothetical protein [Nocardia asiatica]|uniref:hypothetical protein n=1 Tax=Nocardia asiatica TaxID=209252 RepID=UPI0002FB3BEF|nr:hypothetical protein [Nocardia asiatica]